MACSNRYYNILMVKYVSYEKGLNKEVIKLGVGFIGKTMKLEVVE